MLELLIMSGESINDDTEFGLDVSALSSGAIGNYEGRIYPSEVDAAREMIIEDYPRWSESAGALCARFLSKALNLDAALKSAPKLNNFRILIRIVPHGRESRARLLEQYDVQLDGSFWVVTGLDACWRVPTLKSKGSVVATVSVLKFIYWGSRRIPSVKPFNVPVYKEPTFAYVIMGEIPEPAQSAFRKNMAHSGRPHIPGVRDAAYSWDWDDFLAGAR